MSTPTVGFHHLKSEMCLEDSEFEENRQKLSDNEEDRAMQDDSGNENCQPSSSADSGTGDESSGDESSESEAEALPHFGYFRSRLQGRGREVEVWSDGSSDGKDSSDHAGLVNEDGCYSDDADRMDICDSEDPESSDHNNSVADINDDHRGYMVEDDNSCAELEVGSADYDDDLNGYEADIEDSCDHPSTSFAVNDDGSDADIEDNCATSEVDI